MCLAVAGMQKKQHRQKARVPEAERSSNTKRRQLINRLTRASSENAGVQKRTYPVDGGAVVRGDGGRAAMVALRAREHDRFVAEIGRRRRVVRRVVA